MNEPKPQNELHSYRPEFLTIDELRFEYDRLSTIVNGDGATLNDARRLTEIIDCISGIQKLRKLIDAK